MLKTYSDWRREDSLKSILAKSVFLMTITALGAAGNGLFQPFCQAEETAKGKLQEILRSEVTGKPIDRKGELAEWLDRTKPQIPLGPGDTKSQEAMSIRWQAGEFLVGSAWTTPKDLESHEGVQGFSRYEKVRGTGQLDLESHRRIAKWCKEEGFTDRAKAHWFAVLEFDPSDLEARRELGFLYLFGRWVSPEEMKSAKVTTQSVSDSLRKWMPRVREWVSA